KQPWDHVMATGYSLYLRQGIWTACLSEPPKTLWRGCSATSPPHGFRKRQPLNEFRCNASRRDGKLPSQARESGECRLNQPGRREEMPVMKRYVIGAALFCALIVVAPTAWPQANLGLTMAPAEQLGMSKQRLDRIHEAL